MVDKFYVVFGAILLVIAFVFLSFVFCYTVVNGTVTGANQYNGVVGFGGYSPQALLNVTLSNGHTFNNWQVSCDYYHVGSKISFIYNYVWNIYLQSVWVRVPGC